jgi:hypothetical protein
MDNEQKGEVINQIADDNAARLAFRWAVNGAANFESGIVKKHYGLSKLNQSLKDLPCLLVLAGPSLNRQIPFLKEFKGKAMIMCCDAALTPLHKAGVIPDIVVTAESRLDTTKFYKTSSGDHKKMLLAAPTVAPPEVLELGWREIFFFNPPPFSEWPLLKAFREFMFTEDKTGGAIGHVGGGNVGAVMITLARVLFACDPLAFVGADFCWYDWDVTHCDDSKARKVELSDLVKGMRDINENYVYTNRRLMGFRHYFECHAREVPGTYYNCTGAGLLHRGFNLVPLKYFYNLIEHQPKTDWWKTIKGNDTSIEKGYPMVLEQVPNPQGGMMYQMKGHPGHIAL